MNVAIIGKVDNGRSMLASLIANRLAFTYNKTASIKFNNAATTIEYVVETSDGEYKIVDINRYGRMKTMLNSYELSGAIAVVSATEGMSGQLCEQLFRLHSNNVNNLAVFLNLCDEQNKHLIAPIVSNIRETLETYGYSKDTPILCGSAKSAKDEGNIGQIDTLVDMLKLWDMPE